MRKPYDRAIIVKHDPPPIPWRGADYSATFEDYDLGDPTGVGPTPEAAIADLKMEAEMEP